MELDIKSVEEEVEEMKDGFYGDDDNPDEGAYGDDYECASWARNNVGDLFSIIDNLLQELKKK